jgi:hypothetical protein
MARKRSAMPRGSSRNLAVVFCGLHTPVRQTAVDGSEARSLLFVGACRLRTLLRVKRAMLASPSPPTSRDSFVNGIVPGFGLPIEPGLGNYRRAVS